MKQTPAVTFPEGIHIPGVKPMARLRPPSPRDWDAMNVRELSILAAKRGMK
jgi:hypothetical protein